MLSYKAAKDIGHFELRKGIVKNPIFRVKLWKKQSCPIFAYTCKGQEVR